MASIYQKIHAFALKAQARHRLQLKGYLYQTEGANPTEICKTDCTQPCRCQEAFDNFELEPLTVPHSPQHNLGKTLSYPSDLNDGTNPIDKVISSLRYSSIPHFKLESHTSQPNEHSRNCAVRSGDGWFRDLEESNVWTGPMALVSKTIAGTGHIDSSQILEIDSDTDSSSSSPSTDTESEAEHWLRMKEDHAIGGYHWEEGVNDSEELPRSLGNQVHYSTKDPIVPQNIPLKGMARLRRVSPRAIKTTLQDTEQRY